MGTRPVRGERSYGAQSCCHGFQWGRRDRCGLSKWSSRNSRQCGGLASGHLPLRRWQEWLLEELDSLLLEFGWPEIWVTLTSWHLSLGSSLWRHREPLCCTRPLQKQPPICDHHKTCPAGGWSLTQRAPSLPCLPAFSSLSPRRTPFSDQQATFS